MPHPWIAISALTLAVCCASAQAKSTYTIDVGGPMDELFIGSGWYAVEGPYPQFDNVFRDSKCRWAAQGSTIRLPVFPGVRNTIELRGGMNGEGQRLRCFINGEKAADLPPSPDSVYSFTVAPAMLKGKGWADLRIETEHVSARGAGDTRDLRIAVDWVRVSADAPARNYLREILGEQTWASSSISSDTAPTTWRMRYDPNNVGDTYAPRWFSDVTYDDSAFDLVTTAYVPKMRRGDAAWYRAWVVLAEKAETVRKSLRLPGAGFEKDGVRKVWVNGHQIADGPGSVDERAARLLAEGPNLIVVKLIKGPLPRPSGDRIIEPPRFRGEWFPEKVVFHTGPLVLTSESANVRQLSIRLTSPSGRVVGKAVVEVSELPDGRRGAEPEAGWTLSEFGQHTLHIEDGAGRSQRLPVHFLGVHLFHWGWYSAGSGTRWNGFQPCSNDYIDQLFSRLGDWGRPHHSITWGGAILEPGTGFHKTEKVDYIAKHREAIRAGQLEFVGAPFPPRNICTDFGESLLRSMRRSADLYESQLGTRPTRFVSHDSTVNPMLPQIMRLCGYDTYCQAENWWGQGRSIPGSRDCYWRTPDGSAVRMLDSWYHGITPGQAARRAIDQGKPAVLCNEEFACLDRTVFLEEKELTDLAAEGIFLQPITLAEYQRTTESFAREFTYEGDDALCYKGWTGGGEGEVEYEKANRLLETRLVALENLIAWARWLGVEVDGKPVDEWWNLSLRAHECHNHWGNGYAHLTTALWDSYRKAGEEMKHVCGLISNTAADGPLVVFNPLGFRRGGLAGVETQTGARSLAAPDGKLFALQPDPDKPGAFVASLPDLPSIGYRRYVPSTVSAPSPDVKVAVSAKGATLDNGIVRVHMAPNGEITSLVDCKTGRKLLANANRLHLARPQDKPSNEPLSTQENPLNLSHYVRATSAGAPRIVCRGPVISAVEMDLTAPGYAGVTATVRISLAAGERQARVRLGMRFDQPTVVCPPGAPGPHEGTYFPGIFVSFPMPADAEPLADMAYCTTDGVLTSTNHETFMREPFRNGTFNTLSLAGPNTGDYAVLTRGLPDFFVIRRPSSYMGMSLGVGAPNCPYNGSYSHEYAVYAPDPAERGRARVLTYKAAQSFLVEPVAITCGRADMPWEASFLGVDSDSVIVPGVQLESHELRARVLNLVPETATVRVTGLLKAEGATLLPENKPISGSLDLPPCAVRELSVRTRK